MYPDAKRSIDSVLSKRKKNEPDFKQAENLLTYTDQTHLRELIRYNTNWKHCFSSIFKGDTDKTDLKKKKLRFNYYYNWYFEGVYKE
jgi:hypothetical protein